MRDLWSTDAEEPDPHVSAFGCGDLDRVSVEDVSHDARRLLTGGRGGVCPRAGVEHVAAEGEAADDAAYADDDHQGDDRQREESNRRARDHRPTPLGGCAIPVERAASSSEPHVPG